ncbi:hypothetical protein BOTBODRAFT_69143 [Botryobasidium botryosum FD-172 SS1]|uniref:Ribosomal L1 domain-containing protein 1 n=1 Tax=Botryobasidium botryosum (strain FD-172 SS1) TaxID=930990 RepID=A0A067M122_BOTB1|nr:hypothetical protein BOTBODRAFT_69143 [Botryobasidium botryosum FD-172 SS1]
MATIDSHVSVKQAKLAVNALLKHEQKVQDEHEETELLPDKASIIWLVVAVKQMHPEKKLMPHRIPLAYPLVDPRTTPICLITKDPQREYKDLLEKTNVKFISRVVGVTKLKGKFKSFEARRQLLQEHGLFLADDRVIPMLPKLLGKMWFKAKKQPIPVNLKKKDVKAELEKAVSATYMHQNKGTCTSIKIADFTQTAEKTIANLTSAIPAIVANIKGGWDNVQSLHIKTSKSVSLPIWTCELSEGADGRWAEPQPGPQSDSEEEGGDEESDSDEKEVEEDEVVQEAPRVESAGKGKKRKQQPAAEKVEEASVPKKKAKALEEPAKAPASTTPANPEKKKRRPGSASKVTVVVETPAAPSESPARKNRRERRANTASAVTATATDTDAGAPPQSVKVTSAEPAAVTVEVTSTPEPTKSRRRRTAAATAPKAAESAFAPVVSESPSASKSKERKQKKAEGEAAPAAAPASSESAKKPTAVVVSTEELKTKRAGRLEKKKERVKENKGKGMGRGAKGAVVGVSGVSLETVSD